MEAKELLQAIKMFIIEQGFPVSEDLDQDEAIYFDSLDYLALVLYLEKNLKLEVDYNKFFMNIPEFDTLGSIYKRLSTEAIETEEGKK